MIQNNDNFRFIVRRGPQPNQVFELNKDLLTLGRDITNDITINDPEVSRHHLRITRGTDGYTIEDLGSTNGTFINGQRLTGSRALNRGDMIGLGETVTLSYDVMRPQQQPATPPPYSQPQQPPAQYSQPQQPPSPYAPPPQPTRRCHARHPKTQSAEALKALSYGDCYIVRFRLPSRNASPQVYKFRLQTCRDLSSKVLGNRLKPQAPIQTFQRPKVIQLCSRRRPGGSRTLQEIETGFEFDSA